MRLRNQSQTGIEMCANRGKVNRLGRFCRRHGLPDCPDNGFCFRVAGLWCEVGRSHDENAIHAFQSLFQGSGIPDIGQNKFSACRLPLGGFRFVTDNSAHLLSRFQQCPRCRASDISGYSNDCMHKWLLWLIVAIPEAEGPALRSLAVKPADCLAADTAGDRCRFACEFVSDVCAHVILPVYRCFYCSLDLSSISNNLPPRFESAQYHVGCAVMLF